MAIATGLIIGLGPGVATSAGPEAFDIRRDSLDLGFELVEETAAVGRG